MMTNQNLANFPKRIVNQLRLNRAPVHLDS